MNHKILQVLTVAFSVTLAGSYVYFAGKPKMRPVLKPNSIDVTKTADPDKRSPAGPTFTSDLDLIPGTKSFRIVPPDISGSNPTPDTNQTAKVQGEAISNTLQKKSSFAIKEQAIFDALQKKSSFSIKQQSLREIAKTFSTQYGIDIVIDEASLREQRTSADAAITLELPSVSLRSALKLILAPLDLTYSVESGILRIISRDSEMILGTKAGLIDLADDIPMPPILKDLYQTPNPTSK